VSDVVVKQFTFAISSLDELFVAKGGRRYSAHIIRSISGA